MVQPNLDYLADKVIANVYLKDRISYEATAAEWSYKHASKHQVRARILDGLVNFANAESFTDRQAYKEAVHDLRDILDNCPQSLKTLL